MVQEVPIQGETIRLGQLLKLVGAIDSGSEAKAFLTAEPVSVNEELEPRRGRKLRAGDLVAFGDRRLRILAGPHM